MPRRIVVIQGHPDPEPRRLCRALADAYAEGAQEAGHSVTRVDIAALDFPLLRTQHAFEHEPVPDSLRPAQEAIVAAEHIVLVFPLWLGTMPALVKAFLEQVMRPGVAFAYQEKGNPKLLLGGRSARLVVTMGMPAFVYRFWYFAHGLKGLERNILRFVGIAPVRETLFGMVGAASEDKRRAWLEKMRVLGAKGA
ncbi:NAD(P)H-dependent oxidoreductase [Azospirillum sp.]|uniref:NAD(P)H-dependent oxidoreductase n=1 Tax=Azospirillum sp. TaxID=34012 RepID=UPI002D58B328|nr:NAD(P)H-dependent oxidoreductase [Azospirillum sp.]HYD68592.1 NAD(P)H-dependent oxidoreductase [Azospirillum sp.]